MTASPAAPMSMRMRRPTRSTAAMATMVKTTFTAPVMAMFHKMSATGYPASLKITVA